MQGILVMHVCGELDLLTAANLAEQIQRELTRQRCRVVVVDLSGVEFVDARGLAVLIRARHTADGLTQVVLAGPAEPTVRPAVDIAEFGDAFTHHRIVEDALTDLAARARPLPPRCAPAPITGGSG